MKIIDNPEDIFDWTTTGMGGYEEDLVKGRNLDYLNHKMNLKGKIVYMSPNEYYRQAANILSRVHEKNISSFDLKKQRNVDPKYIKELEEVITKRGEKFPVPYLNVSDRPGQEGLHRMMVAGNLYGWNTKFPVLLVENYSDAKPEEVLEEIVNKVKQNEYRNWNEVISLADKLMMNSIFHENFSVDFTDDESEMIFTGEYRDKEYTAYEDVDEFKVKPQSYNKEKEDRDEDRFLKQLDL